MRYSIIILPLMVVFLSSCPWSGYEYNEGTLPGSPVNLEAFNTEYDDYNMSSPIFGDMVPFCFSTNRHSLGEEFNIRYDPMSVVFSRTTGELTLENEYGPWNSLVEEFGVLLNAVKKVNTTGNELGPCLLYSREADFADAQFVLMYASDLGGDFDIGYTFNSSTSDFSDSQPVAFLNSGFNDLYPSFNSDFSKIYFCSDREGEVFNIFKVDVEYSGDSIIGVLSSTGDHVIEIDAVLSSEYDDKCPYIFENTLVFTSNRPGGSGGFDLYYSKFEGGQWGTPVNFGAVINTAFDEYRPILFEEDVDNDRDMMIFSSNRSGGKGGFDLYFVGVIN
ncbi:MAG: PD40 domain-containing protein [Bacteroidales bacterium]|nr:PD40 domain-containing protein [Bacteroidales bacterium]